jgi:hypothetical protein
MEWHRTLADKDLEVALLQVVDLVVTLVEGHQLPMEHQGLVPRECLFPLPMPVASRPSWSQAKRPSPLLTSSTPLLTNRSSRLVKLST